MRFNLKCKTNLVIFLYLFSILFPSGALASANTSTQINVTENSNINLDSNISQSINKHSGILNILKCNAYKIPEISSECPFNEVDAMILSNISYLPMSMVSSIDSPTGKKSITLKEWYESLSLIINEKKDMTDLYLHSEDKHNMEFYIKNCNTENKYLENRLKLLSYLANCPRYRDITINDFSGKYADIREENPQQFAAVTFTLNSGEKVIIYRGTDSTLAGWKEDADLSWKEEIESQKDAKNYLCKINKLYPNSLIYVGGHSKGGNLAVYSSVKAASERKEIIKNIVKIFNFDGPGLRSDIISNVSDIYNQLKDRLFTFIPQSSIIGRIMNNLDDHNLKCVYSVLTGISQHDTFSWEINESYFKKTEAPFHISILAPESDMVAEAVENILRIADKNSLQTFSDSLFEFLEKNDISFESKESMLNIIQNLAYKYSGEIKQVLEVAYSEKEDNLSELENFKKVISIIIKSLFSAYWSKFELINNSLNISEEFTTTLKELKESNFSFENSIKVLWTVVEKIFNINSLGSLVWRILK